MSDQLNRDRRVRKSIHVGLIFLLGFVGYWLVPPGSKTVMQASSMAVNPTAPQRSGSPPANSERLVDPIAPKPAPQVEPVQLDPMFAAKLAAATRITDPELRRAALVKACFNQAEKDPAQAVEVANYYGLGRGPGAVLENLTQQWAQTDLPAAYDWVSAMPANSAGRDELVGRIAFVWSQNDPAQASSWLLQQTTPGPQQEEMVLSVIHQWGLRDRNGVSAWVAEFPKGAFRDRAIAEVNGLATVAGNN